MADKLRILLAEDHRVVRAGLTLLINRESDMQVIGEADNGKQAVQKALEMRPDLIVMDLSMPEMNGLQATKAIKAVHPEIKILVLTTHEDEIYLRQVCEAQAAGYVLKRSAGEELIRGIRRVAAGELHFDSVLAGKALANRVRQATAKREPTTTELSEREKTILRGVAWGYSNKELAGQLGISVKTVETYKVRIASKLGLHGRAETVQYALRQGWLSEGESAPRLAS